MVYKFRVEMTYDKKLNYIRHLNDLDKIWKIKIFNDGEETVRGLQIKLSFVPDFAESWIGHIDEIKAGERADINEPNLVINPEKLLSYNEKLEGNIIVELMPADGQSEAVYKEAFPLTVLPYDQWLSNDHPELLAAFVTPNDRRVLEILAKAGKRLGVQEGIAFSGYGSKQEVLRQMQVIFEVIQEEQISYCYPPANWDRGQRVRMPGFTLANKLGCCIDMAVLYASCLEAASLNPLVMILHGHAVAGCWLKDASFEKTIIDDRASVESRSYNKLGELAMVECTLMDNYAGIIGGFAQHMSIGEMISTLGQTLKNMWKAMVTVIAIIALAKVMGYSGMTTAIATLLADLTGSIFPLFAPICGILGTFVTGSTTSSGVLFAKMQYEVAELIGANPVMLVAANLAGGGIGKLISPQSIAIGVAAIGLEGSDGKIMTKTVGICIVLGVIVCIMSYLLAVVL